MKKYYRNEIETFEKAVVNYINNRTGDCLLVQQVAEKIFAKFGYEIRAEHVGNSYDSIGDIKIINKNNQIFFIELKKINQGRGTLANISQDALTKYGIFPMAMSWSDYRANTSFDEKVIKAITLYNPNFNFSTKTNFYKVVREYKKEADFKNYQLAIEAIARQDKINYLKCLSSQPIDQSALQLFVLNMLTGKHTEKLYYNQEQMNYNTLLILPNSIIWLEPNSHNPENNFTIQIKENQTWHEAVLGPTRAARGVQSASRLQPARRCRSRRWKVV
jgi:hypothetical protein